MKICRTCKGLLEEKEFYFLKKTQKLCSECKSCVKTRSNKRYRSKKTEILKQMSLYSKEQYKLNPQKFRERHKIYELNNIEKIRLRKKLFRANPLNKLKRKNYRRGRSKIDKNYVIKERLRKRMWAALKGKLKCDKTINLLGCNMSQLHSYLESKFQTGMNWNNYGANGWHIDHIIPCSSFNLLEPSEQKKCFHYTNLQPLWWRDNIVKRDKL